jgi:DNA polymerase-4
MALRYLCPGIDLVQAGKSGYIKIHEQIKELIHGIIYGDVVLSLDEMYVRLPRHWQPPEVARKKAMEIKTVPAAENGEQICASIGLAPNRFLADAIEAQHSSEAAPCESPLTTFPIWNWSGTGKLAKTRYSEESFEQLRRFQVRFGVTD